MEFLTLVFDTNIVANCVLWCVLAPNTDEP